MACPQRLHPGARHLRERRIAGRGQLGQIARLGRLDLSRDDIARRSEGAGRDELAQPLEPRRVEPAAFEQRACRWVDLVEDHDARTGIGNDDP